LCRQSSTPRRAAASGSQHAKAASRRKAWYDATKFNRSDGPAVLRPRTIQAAGAFLLLVLAGCAPQQPQGAAEIGRYLVYFNEFSAKLSPDASNVIAEAAAKVKEYGAKTVRIEGRASATGSPAANQHLTETRTQVVYDALQKDGVDPTMIQQQPLGQTTTSDTSVMDRRVDIVLLK
jgi:outer membrane protein OmpA-like peptidoglycan-associated protein